jgi:VIT1/CCC1 family predicted Fe2+/Mn2+ transporter
MVSDEEIDALAEELRRNSHFMGNREFRAADVLLALKAERAELRKDRDYWLEFQMKTDKAAVAILSTARAEALEEARQKIEARRQALTMLSGARDAGFNMGIASALEAIDALDDRD